MPTHDYTIEYDLVRFYIAVISLSLTIASRKQTDADKFTPPEKVGSAAQQGLDLHEKFGGGKNLQLAGKIAQGSKLTLEDIEAMQDYFRNEDIETQVRDLGWGNLEAPSSEWINWLLMGGFTGRSWSRNIQAAASREPQKEEVLIAQPQ